MSNLTEIQRNQFERYELADTGAGSRLLRASPTERRVFGILTALLMVVLGILTYAAVQVFDGWPHLIVLGDLVLVFLGLAAWVYPKRRNA
jgi:hypothetical protein